METGTSILLVMSLITVVGFGIMGYLQISSDKKKGIEYFDHFTYISGIENLEQGIEIKIKWYKDKLEFDNYFIPLSRIKKVDLRKGKTMTEQQKSIIGRALAGGVLMGGLGAVLGGLTGLGSKKVQEDVYLFSVEYIDTNGNDKYALFAKKSISHILEHMCNEINQQKGIANCNTNQTYEI